MVSVYIFLFQHWAGSNGDCFFNRRGYATERQKGLLIVDKLDYIQSRLLRGLFSIISKPLGRLGSWIAEVVYLGILVANFDPLFLNI